MSSALSGAAMSSMANTTADHWSRQSPHHWFDLNDSNSGGSSGGGEKDGNSGRNGYRDDWFDILSKAEQVVKYPTSFLSLRFFLKDEISYLAIHLKRLIDTKHPLLQTAKSILSANQQIRGLIVLLVSKCYLYPKHVANNDGTVGSSGLASDTTDRTQLIANCQRKLAEITDMVHVSQVLHRGVVDLPTGTSGADSGIDVKLHEDLTLGNTISVLIGDFLLAQSSRGLALIRNPTITGLIAKAIGNYSEAEFLRLELMGGEDNNDSLSREALEKYCYLSGGSLLAHSCQSAILLAQYDQQIQNEAFNIGRHIGIAFQLSDMLYRHLSNDHKTANDFDDNHKMFDTNLMKQLLDTSIRKAIDLINILDKCEARDALQDIVSNLANVQNVNDFH